jgi:hypothetical protein
MNTDVFVIKNQQQTGDLQSMTETKIEVHVLNSPVERLYEKNRRVSFFGGEGIVRSSSLEGGTWKYLVEMPQGKEPTFGRAGAETMVLLTERELRAA